MRALNNPFRSERIEALPFRCAGMELRPLAWRALTLRACAVVGPTGSGKTTLLEALAAEFESMGFGVRLLRAKMPESLSSGGDLVGVPRPVALFLDGIESAGGGVRPQLRRLERAAEVLVVSAHRPGILPTLVELRTAPSLLSNLILELVGLRAVEELAPEIPELFLRHRGDVRACLRELYDRWAERPDSPAEPTQS